MNIEHLLQHSDELICHMENDGYSKSYIRLLKIEINWLKKNGHSVDSYEEACQVRQHQTESKDMQRRYRLEYGILKRFDFDGMFPDYRRKEPLIKRGAYHLLNSSFKDTVDVYRDVELRRGLKPETVKGNVSAISCFLPFYAEQGMPFPFGHQ